MSVVPVKVPARRRSVFHEDFDVMSGYRLSYSGEFPTVRFAATVWDFTSVPDIPKGLARSYLVIDWNRVDSRWRVLVKELLAAMLCPLHPAVVALPQRRHWPLPFISLRMTVSQVSHWLEWLDGEGIGSLDAVTQQSCDGYLLQFEHQSPGYRMNRVIAVRWLRHYAPVLSDGYRDGFMPWGRRSSSEVAGFTTGANKTPSIRDQALHATLTGALFLLGRPAEDVIAARTEARALPRSKSAPFSVERFNEGVAKLARDYVARGVPLPRSPYSGQDALSQINLGLLARRAGVKPVSPDAIKPETRNALLQAMDRVGIAAGGLLATPSIVDTPTGPRMWTDPFDGRNHRHLLSVIAGACTTVIAGLSGLRESELHELGVGCVQRIDLGDGQVRWCLRGKVIKHRPHGGEPESWTVIEEVAHAARIQAQLVTAGADRLFASVMPNAAPTSHSNLNRLVRTFIDWQNTKGRELGLPAVPEPDGRRVSVRQFRRTLARQLAYQPHGTIAGKIHLKHIRATVTEGYFGAPGESAAAFLEDVEREMQEARVENYERRFRAWQAGEPLGGGGALGMTREFEALAASFNGVVDLSDRRTRQLIRKRAGLLHIGPVNDCHFTDPRQARCLARRGIKDADGPIIAACQPSKCANAIVAREHLPQWQAPVLQIDNLLEDRKVPRTNMPAFSRSGASTRPSSTPWREPPMGQHEGAVRAAMDRLFAGQAGHADGRLTVKNLAVEAAIPRSTLYRAEPKLVREFERRLQHTQDTAHPVRGGLPARVARLEAKLAATETRAAGYRDDLEQERRRSRGLANQIALLDAERRKLEDQLTTSKPIASLDAHRRRWQTQGES